MRIPSWATHIAAIGTLCLLASVSFARPHTDSAHRSALPVTLTLTTGAQYRNPSRCGLHGINVFARARPGMAVGELLAR